MIPAPWCVCVYANPISAKRDNTSVTFRYELRHRDTGDLHASSDTTKAVVDMNTFKARTPPAKIREAFEKLLITDD